MEIAVRVHEDILVEPTTGAPIVLLKETNGPNSLLISVGQFEARAIGVQLHGIAIPRPMTHDLLRSVFTELGWAPKKVVVCDLRENTYFAAIHAERGDGAARTIDARPSDAIALALRAGCPIYVESGVFEKIPAEQRAAEREALRLLNINVPERLH